MVLISVQPAPDGFWYLIDVEGSHWFTLEFFAMGPGGHLLRDEISGYTEMTPGWIFYPSDFPLQRVGIIECQIFPTEIPKFRESRSPERYEPVRRTIDAVSFSRLFGGEREGLRPRHGSQRESGRSSRTKTVTRGQGSDIPYPVGVPYPSYMPYGFYIPYQSYIPYGTAIPYPPIPYSDIPYPMDIPYEIPYGGKWWWAPIPYPSPTPTPPSPSTGDIPYVRLRTKSTPAPTRSVRVKKRSAGKRKTKKR